MKKYILVLLALTGFYMATAEAVNAQTLPQTVNDQITDSVTQTVNPQVTDSITQYANQANMQITSEMNGIAKNIILTNYSDRAVWVTVYNSLIPAITDKGCLPPGKGGYFSGYVGPLPFNVRFEVKERDDCGGGTIQDMRSHDWIPATSDDFKVQVNGGGGNYGISYPR